MPYTAWGCGSPAPPGSRIPENCVKKGATGIVFGSEGALISAYPTLAVVEGPASGMLFKAIDLILLRLLEVVGTGMDAVLV